MASRAAKSSPEQRESWRQQKAEYRTREGELYFAGGWMPRKVVEDAINGGLMSDDDSKDKARLSMKVALGFQAWVDNELSAQDTQRRPQPVVFQANTGGLRDEPTVPRQL